MALSVMGGDYPDVAGLPVDLQDDVLCELNAEFKQSKSELIQRFLKDQEDLNEKFAEYELNSEDGQEPLEEGFPSPGSSSSSSQRGLPGAQLPGGGSNPHQDKGEVYDVLQDIEDKDFMDNLSITSAVNSSSDAPSLSDGMERASYEDLDEEKDYDENWNVTQQKQQYPPGMYDDQYYDQYSRDGPAPSLPTEYHSSIPQQHPLDSVPQPRRSKKNKEATPTRKIKKLLVKKNVRPQTSMGVRALPPDADHFLFGANNSDNRSLISPNPGPANPSTFTLHDSINMVGARFKKISWNGGGAGMEHKPEMGRLSISASVHKLPPRSHTPGGRLKSCSSPLVSTSGLSSLRGGLDRGFNPAETDGNLTRPPSHCEPLRHSKTPVEQRPDPFRSGTPLGRSDSSLSTRSSLLSVDFGPDTRPTDVYGRRQSPNRTSGGQTLMRSVYSAERAGRIVVSPSLAADVKGKKRPIAVLKLPPLDSSVVNRAIGAANIDPTGHQSSLVSPATAKSNTVATPSAI